MVVEKWSVLLIEDSDHVRFTIKAMLEEMGISDIDEAVNGVQAMNKMKGDPNHYNLIICDWNMPEKTGLELLREFRKMKPHTPFLMVTARADKESIVAALKHNVTAYIRKPFTINDLRNKINALSAAAN